MERFSDPRLEEIFCYRVIDSLPRSVSVPAHRMARLLAAARDEATLTLFAEPVRFDDGRIAVHVHKNWHISFEWDGEVGAHQMRLEKK